ncbi:uncharacterized protein LOC144085347 [Stigmatopora argus]
MEVDLDEDCSVQLHVSAPSTVDDVQWTSIAVEGGRGPGLPATSDSPSSSDRRSRIPDHPPAVDLDAKRESHGEARRASGGRKDRHGRREMDMDMEVKAEVKALLEQRMDAWKRG